jgi:hypothetical protein
MHFIILFLLYFLVKHLFCQARQPVKPIYIHIRFLVRVGKFSTPTRIPHSFIDTNKNLHGQGMTRYII